MTDTSFEVWTLLQNRKNDSTKLFIFNLLIIYFRTPQIFRMGPKLVLYADSSGSLN